MPATLMYPRFYGNPVKMRKYFRLRKTFPIGDPNRYPVPLKLPFQVHISFGKIIGNKEGLTINTDSAIRNSSDKVSTKMVWSRENANSRLHRVGIVDRTNAGGPERLSIPYISEYVTHQQINRVNNFYDLTFFRNKGFPFLAKLRDASRGKGMRFLANEDELIQFLSDANVDNEKYFYEKFFRATSEYRVHVSPWLKDRTYEFIIKDANGNNQSRVIARYGAFLAVKKLIDAEEHARLISEQGYVTRNFSEHLTFSSRFTPPRNWDEMLKQAVLAIQVLGLDFGFVDVMYDSTNGIYKFSESGCNPGMGRLQEDENAINLTAQVYQQALKYIILNKAQSLEQFRVLIPDTCAE